MDFIKNIAQRLLTIIQFILVFIFILFEEVIWEGLAEPIYRKIDSLNITKKIEILLDRFNSKILLLIFVLLLLGVEGIGLLAGFFFVKGQMLLGLILYISKIPIAGFTFWIFKVSKPKLLRFSWFKWAYKKVINAIAWLKEREIYQESIEMISKMKLKLFNIKKRYFSKESSFVTEMKLFYKYIKNFKNRKKDD